MVIRCGLSLMKGLILSMCGCSWSGRIIFVVHGRSSTSVVVVIVISLLIGSFETIEVVTDLGLVARLTANLI